MVVWGAFAFGAVYAWAYWPLFVVTAAMGIICFSSERSWPAASVHTAVVRAFAIVAAAVAFQLVPLPQAVIATISPATDEVLRQRDVGYASGLFTWHPLSIDPPATRIALAAFVSLAIFSLGLSRALARANVTTLAFGIAAIGLALAVHGVIQRSTGTLLIYGFWRPVHQPFQIYGPFVNKNHYAGWMIMAIPLALGVACAALVASSRDARSDWRNRVLWSASPDGARFALATLCVFAMGVATVLTLSRSGIGVFFAIIVMFAVLLLRRRTGARRTSRAVAVAVTVMIAIGVLGWTGLEPVVQRFATGQSISGRLPGWTGAIRIASEFPITGSGLNTFKAAMLHYTTRAPDGPYWDVAHDDYLQLASEGGLLIVIPVILAIVVVARDIRRRSREDHDDRTYWIRAGAAVGMVGIGLQEIVDFSLQIPGNAVLLAVLCAIATHVPGRPRRVLKAGGRTE